MPTAAEGFPDRRRNPLLRPVLFYRNVNRKRNPEMSKRMTCLLTLGVLALPLPAYADGGPAMPQESWFSESKGMSVVLTHLDAARQAQGVGDEEACLESVQQAETALKDGAG